MDITHKMAAVRRMCRYAGAVLCGIALTAPSTGLTAILAAQSGVQPATSLLAIGQGNSLVLSWTVTSVFVGFPGTLPYTVTSTAGQFVAAGTVVGSVSSILTVSGSAVAGVPTTLRISESVFVPPDVTVKANRLGATTISYVRQFNDGSGPVALQAGILVGGSAAAQLGISREALTFDDGSVVRTVLARDPLTSVAEINFNGSGSITAVWEVAGPSTTAGQPVFRVLQPVTRGLLGAAPTFVKSVLLPTDSPGAYMVRLRIVDPAPAFDPPMLTYYVGDVRSAVPGGIAPMTVMRPADGAVFDRETRFAWQPISGAAAYKVELFASPDSDPFGLPELTAPSDRGDLRSARAALARPPVSGMIVPATQTEIALSSAARAKLRPRSSYFWRVQAIGTEGNVIGEATVRQVRVP